MLGRYVEKCGKSASWGRIVPKIGLILAVLLYFHQINAGMTFACKG
jgi:hypothetical protein